MKSSAICREWLNSLPPTQGYLKKEQSIGREVLFEKGMPSNKDEAWRLCNFNRLNSFLSLPIIINNKDLSSKHSIKWIWVKGHAQNKYNNIVDELAQGAIKR